MEHMDNDGTELGAERFGLHETSAGYGASAAHGAASPGAANYYGVLDVAPTATRVEIREAYLRLKNTYGGDGAALYSLIDEDEAKSQLLLVEEAYRVLYDDVLRREHDTRLGIARGPRGTESSSIGDGGVQSPRGGASTQATALDAGVERLLLARERGSEAGAYGGHQSPAPAGARQRVGEVDVADDANDAGVVRTQRSTLPIIKLQAQRTGPKGDDLKAEMQAMIDASDAGDGDLFKRLRELAQVSEDELQERTKVSIGYIRAIELNRFDRLPQVVYVKGFLRSFFRYMAVPDADKLVAAFSQRLTEWQVANRKG
jgi:hypothetical protein